MPQYGEKPTLLTLRLSVRPDANTAFMDWQAKFNAKIVTYPGFISLEFLCPSDSQEGWLIVQRLTNAETASSWHNSEQFKELMEELKGLVGKDGIQEAADEESDIQERVTEIIVTKISPENEQSYQEWSAKIHQAEAKFPGFRGVYVQSPGQNKNGNWITLLQFDTMENLDRWLESPERQELLNESNSFVTSFETHRVISPYSGWFASIAKVGEIPPVWKQTMIVLLVLYPIVMIELKYLSPLTAGLDLSLATFIGNAISVTLISFPMMPIAIWFLGWWLIPNRQTQQRLTILGTLVVMVLYLIEIWVFWKF